MPTYQNTLIRPEDRVTNSSTVLRNTYLLLSLTLLFSAGCASFAVTSGASFGSSIVAIVASFVLLFATSALRNSGWGIITVFAFTGCMGYSLGPMLNYYIHGFTNGGHLIAIALGGTGATFFLSSMYILATKKDLSYMGKFLTIGLVICIVAGLANLFFKMPAMQLALSCMMTFISALLMMYDTSRIINNGETNYILATMSLYIDIQMMFQNLLMLLGAFGDRK
jgi:modulator of FtsH protease